MIQASNGNLYGTTSYAGVSADHVAGGMVFKIISSGGIKPIYHFCALADCADGVAPQGALVQATDGNFYGTTVGRGAKMVALSSKLVPRGI